MTDSKPTLQKVLGVAHFSAITLPPSQFVRCAAKAGFNAVGLRLHPAFPGAPYYELPKGSKSAAEFRALLDSEGMSVFDIEFFVIDPQFDAAAVEAIVAAAADIGARRLSACGDDADRQRLVDNLGSFCTVAARHGMAVDLENMGWRTVSTYRESATIINDCAQTNAGVLVDAIHFFRNGGNINEIDRNIVRHVQLCDVSGAPPATPEGLINEARSGRLAPGEGLLPLHDLLAAVGDGAAISVEVPLVGTSDAKDHLRNLNLKARRLLRSFQ